MLFSSHQIDHPMLTRNAIRRLVLLALAAVAVGPAAQPADVGFNPDTVQAGRLDGGKMWLFEAPPYEYLQETYGFRPDTAWFRHARLAALRLPGCSASFVSPHGLVATNHHCVQSYLVEYAREGESLLDNGFASSGLPDERPMPGVYVDQLDAIADVTAEVTRLVDGGISEGDAMDQVEAEMAARRGVAADAENPAWVVQVARLYDGARYSAYTYRRLHDVRLVFAPETQLGFFGGDADNFTYPRYALDFSLLRVYGADGEPMASPTYFPISEEGVSAGDLVFVIGNPGSTSRALTTAGLELQRDLNVPVTLAALRHRAAVLRSYIATNPPDVDEARAQHFGISNSEKVFAGRQNALRDPYVIARRGAAERALLQARPGARALVDSLAQVAAARRAQAPQFRAFALLYGGLGSTVLRRAYLATTLATAEADAAEATRRRFLGLQDRPAMVERGYLAAEIEGLRQYFAETGRPLPTALAGSSADALAERILSTSALAGAESAAAALEAGVPTTDPAMAVVASIHEEYERHIADRTRLASRESALTRRLGLERYAAYGTSVPPDATFSLRFTDGVVRGYPYNGTEAPPMTTLYGLFDRHASFPAPSAWTLPDRWVAARDRLDLSTPLNFTSTSDTIGGNSGSPVLNRELELVGLNFDRTIEGLLRDYLYMANRGRNVMVDARAILESLRNVYDQGELVDELTTGERRD
jgi:hypothetical protein